MAIRYRSRLPEGVITIKNNYHCRYHYYHHDALSSFVIIIDLIAPQLDRLELFVGD